jgi:polyhydroxyalkanoate synthesis regulator phasin
MSIASKPSSLLNLKAGLAVVYLAFASSCPAPAQTSDAALNALVKKGILTAEEAKAALAEQEEQAKAAKPTDQNIRVFWKTA